MKSLRRFILSIIPSGVQQAASFDNHVHLARAYRPVTPKMLPRWRNLGKAITPYHYMRPALIPVEQQATQKNIR